MHPSLRVRRGLALAAAVGLAVGALLPGGDAALPALGPVWLVGADKYAHALGFAVVALLGAWAARNRRERLLVVLAALALGVAIELLQGFVPGRTPDGFDALADAVGVAVGLLVDGLRRRRRES